MAEGKKKVWAVSCVQCNTTVDLPISEFRIISTDQAAEFIKVPKIICGKCKSDCYVVMKEK